MGRKGKWFVAVKRVFSPESEENKGQKRDKSKRRWGLGKCNNFDPESLEDSAPKNSVSAPHEEVKLAENDQSKKSMRFYGKSKEEVAAIMIQTAFRGYLARRALRALRGLVRLKSLTNSDTVKRQTAATLHCMQTLSRVQAQIRSRRIRMAEENQALQRQLQLKHERELEKLRMAEEWNGSFQSKEQIEAHLQNKQEAAMRRERALAYAFSHQGKSSSRSANPTFMDPNNPQWGWSWMERWMAARPWENRNTAGGDRNTDRASVKSAYARRHSPSTPHSKAPSMVGKIKLASPRSRGWSHAEDDLISIQSERPRRHSIAGPSVRDDESLASTTSVRSCMVPTDSAKVKSRHQSSSRNKLDTSSERSSVSSAARKRLSFPLTSN